MATLTVSVPDTLYAAFKEKFPTEQHDEVLTYALIDLLQDDPYSPEALAEDQRRFQEIDDGDFVTHQELMTQLHDNIKRYQR